MKSARRYVARARICWAGYGLCEATWTRTEAQLALRKSLCERYPKLGRAMMLRETLQDVLADQDEALLRWWCQRAKRSRLKPFKQLVERSVSTGPESLPSWKPESPTASSKPLTGFSNSLSVWPAVSAPSLPSAPWLCLKQAASHSISQNSYPLFKTAVKSFAKQRRPAPL